MTLPIELENLTFNILGNEYPLPLDSSDGQTGDGILMYATMLFSVCGYDRVTVKDIADARKECQPCFS
ncbi:MAG: hypothetical protein LBD85_05430 [Oscillospiraceae bacterium]|jgi:hypothetical protein|nr:hypothetical protein [Oscillospiraceae bacterium]